MILFTVIIQIWDSVGPSRDHQGEQTDDGYPAYFSKAPTAHSHSRPQGWEGGGGERGAHTPTHQGQRERERERASEHEEATHEHEPQTQGHQHHVTHQDEYQKPWPSAAAAQAMFEQQQQQAPPQRGREQSAGMSKEGVKEQLSSDKGTTEESAPRRKPRAANIAALRSTSN